VNSAWLLTAPWLLTEAWQLVPHGAVLVHGATIAASGPAAAVRQAAGREAVHLDLDDCLLMPGLVNAHCHLELSALGHLCPARPTAFIPWVTKLIAAKKKLAAADYQAAVAAGQEMLLAAGTTTVGDFCSLGLAASHHLVRPRLRQVRFLEVIGRQAEAEAAVCGELAAALERLAAAPGGLVRPGIAPHAPYTVSLARQRRLLGLARQLNMPYAIHLGESPAEKEYFLTGRGPVSDQLYPLVGWEGLAPEEKGRDSIDLLLSRNLLGEAIVVHLGTATTTQLQRLATAGCRPVVCPRSNHNLGNPLPDVPALLAAGLQPALGTDSLASTGSLSLWDEMRFLADRFPSLAAADLLRLATTNGAATLGLDRQLGRLTSGLAADLIAVRTTSRRPPTPEKLLAATGNREIALVMVAGDIKKRPQ